LQLINYKPFGETKIKHWWALLIFLNFLASLTQFALSRSLLFAFSFVALHVCCVSLDFFYCFVLFVASFYASLSLAGRTRNKLKIL